MTSIHSSRWKRWTVAFTGVAFLLLAFEVGKLHSRALVAMLIRALHGAGPARMWIPGNNPADRTMAKRAMPTLTAPATRNSPPIEFLGAETYLAGEGGPYWMYADPLAFLKRESNCSLTAYTSNFPAATVSPLQSNYQEVLHAQAMLGTTGNRWPSGCTDSRLGVPSGFHIVEQTAAGLYYGALATTYGPFQSQDSITIGLGDESGAGLTSHTSAATPEVPFTLTSVDLNGDGNPDLVVLSADEDTGIAILSVFLGNGDGTYQPRTDYATRIVTTYVTVADVNNDNHPDLIVVGPPASGNSADPALQVFLNNGHGVFGSPINGPALPALRQFDVAVAAVVANFSGSNADIATSAGYVFLGDGTGNFTLKSGIQFSAADGLIAADFNHDDKIDIATVDGSKFTVSIYLGNGDGTFTAGPQYASIFGARNLGVSDLDGDGNPDIIVGTADPHGFGPNHNNDGYAYFLLGRGDGTFAGARSYPAGGVSETGPSIALADVNGDNQPDIITTTGNVSQLSLSLYTLIGNGSGGFTPGISQPIDVTDAFGIPPLVLAGDLNGDSKNDAIVGITTESAESGAAGTGDLAVFLGNGNDTFGSEKDTHLNAGIGAMVLGDFNDDKKPDVIAGGTVSADESGNPASGTVFFLAGQGNGSFASPVPIASAPNPVALASMDLNGDQNLDLVVGDGGAPGAIPPVPGSVPVYLGNGNGTFQAPKALDAPVFAVAVAIADVNQDSHPDIVVLSQPTFPTGDQLLVSTVYVFLGDGHGNFGSAISTTLDEYAAGLQVADLNGDGFPDLAIASCCGFSNSEVWSGNGDGTFNGPVELPIALSSSSLALADLTGDGKSDLLVGTGNSIVAMLNISGEGIPTPIAANATPAATATATPTAVATSTRSATPTATATSNHSPTRTATPTAVPTSTKKATPTATPSVTPTGTTLSAKPAAINFGKVDATGTSKAEKVTLTNKGTATAVISRISASAPFVVAAGGNNCIASLAPKKTCSFDIEFAPASVENVTNGSIEVLYNGTSPTVTLMGDGTAIALKAPTVVSFPAQTPGTFSKAKDWMLSNPNSVEVTLGDALRSGADPGSFTIATDSCSGHTLAPKGKCTIAVEFAPPANASGSQSATLSMGFVYGGNGGTVSTSLTGTLKPPKK